MVRQAEVQAESKTPHAPSVKQQSSFEVAIATAQNIEERRMEAKEAKASGLDRSERGGNIAESKADQQQIRGDGYRLLGNLPSFNNRSGRDVQVRPLSLDSPRFAQLYSSLTPPPPLVGCIVS
jgi:hypothetical protein